MENNDNQAKLQEELFCVKFELNALVNLTIRGEAERWVPGFLWPAYEAEHKLRYDLALNYVKGKKVLDLACGSGYGSYLLAEKGLAVEVLGGDLDAEAIRYGNTRYAHPKVNRAVINAQEFTQKEYFDVAVSFETIEHLTDYKAFLKNIEESLTSGGIFIVSTPVVMTTRTTCENPYHMIEWSFNDFQNLIKASFDIEKIYVQNIGLQKKQPSFFGRVYRTVKRIVKNQSDKNVSVDFSPKEFRNQYPVDKIASGYQILICRKR